MIGYGLDRGGPKDSETAPNSFLTKINGKVFWRFASDMKVYRSKKRIKAFQSILKRTKASQLDKQRPHKGSHL